MSNKAKNKMSIPETEIHAEDDDENEYKVEKIVDMRTYCNGRREFYIKWEGYDDDQNTWEPEKHLHPEMVLSFEKRLRHLGYNINVKKANVKKKIIKKNGNGFDRGFEAEEILGVTNKTGETLFLIKFRDVDEADLVTAAEANKKCPQLVIKFYEKRVVWNLPPAPNPAPKN